MAAVSRMITIINIDTQCSIEEQNTRQRRRRSYCYSFHARTHAQCVLCVYVCLCALMHFLANAREHTK